MIYPHEHLSMCICVYRSQSKVLGAFSVSLYLLPEAETLTELASELSVSACPISPVLGSQAHMVMPSFLYECLRFKLRS